MVSLALYYRVNRVKISKLNILQISGIITKDEGKKHAALLSKALFFYFFFYQSRLTLSENH